MVVWYIYIICFVFMYVCMHASLCGLVDLSGPRSVSISAIIVIDLCYVQYLLKISLPDVSISLYEVSH